MVIIRDLCYNDSKIVLLLLYQMQISWHRHFSSVNKLFGKLLAYFFVKNSDAMTIIFFFIHSKLVNKDKSFFIYSSAVCVFFTNETFRQLIFSKAFSKTLTCMEPIKTSTNIFLSSSPPPLSPVSFRLNLGRGGG